MAGQIILSVAYGIDVRPEGDPYVEDAENVLRAVQLGSTWEATIFDTITWCNTLPLLKERNINHCIAQYSVCRVGFRERASNGVRASGAPSSTILYKGHSTR
jgi:hypothetical protein